MSFQVSPEAYDRFMGRYSSPLAVAFVDVVDVTPGQRALDVGCGSGVLTALLVERLGSLVVSAVDPEPAFVAAVAERWPEVTAQQATAESLPFPDDSFDLVLAQLVVHFMAEPVVGLAQMRRVCRPGGLVAASVWDYSGGTGPLTTFWRAARELDPSVVGERRLAGTGEGQLADLFAAAGMPGAISGRLSVAVRHDTFDDWWEPYTLGVGPAGDHVSRLSPAGVAELRERCRAALPEPPFTIEAGAWTALWHKTGGGVDVAAVP